MLARDSRFQAVGAIPRTVGSPAATPSWSTSLCVLRALARTQNTHKRVEKYYLRRSRNVYGVLPLQFQEAEGFLGIGVMGTR